MINLNEQMLAFEANCDEAFDNLIEWMCEKKDDIIEAARERMVEGFDLYGDEMWTWTPEQRDSAKVEELADAVNYSIPDM